MTDEFGATATQDVTITITGANDAPTVAAALTAAADEGDALLTLNLIDGASDIDSGETATLSVANVTGLVDGLTLVGTDLRVDPSHEAFRALTPGQTSEIILTYDVVDVHGGRVAQSLTVTITGTNSAPTANDDTASMGQNDIRTVLAADGLISNDTDPDGDTLTVAAVSGVEASVGQAVTLASGAIVTINADGSYTFDTNHAYDALPLYDPALETISYTITDGLETSQANLTLEIAGANDAPTAVDDVFSTNSDTEVGGNLFTNNGFGSDYDVDGGSASVTGINGGGLFATLASGATVSADANGTFTYDASGATRAKLGTTYDDSFTYTLTDEYGLSDTATVTVHVTETLAAAPIVINETVIYREDGWRSGGSGGTDAPDGYGADGQPSSDYGPRGYDSLASNSDRAIETGYGADQVTLTAITRAGAGGSGGRGGQGGDSGPNNMGPRVLDHVTLKLQYENHVDETTYYTIQMGSGGRGADGRVGSPGGDGEATLSGNRISTLSGGDAIVLSGQAVGGVGGDGGDGGAGGAGVAALSDVETRTGYDIRQLPEFWTFPGLGPGSGYAVEVTRYDYVTYLAGATGEAGLDGSNGRGGNATVSIVDNEIHAGRGDDVITLTAKATGGALSNGIVGATDAHAVFTNNILDGGEGNDTIRLATQ